MIKYNGMKAEKEAGRQLPPGGYVCNIVNVENREGDSKNGHWKALVISFDIYEGDYAGFFTDNYKNQNPKEGEEKKWKGNIFVSIPLDDNSDMDEVRKRQFNNLLYVLEESNKDFSFNGDENTMKGKLAGLLFRREEWEYMDKSGWATRAFKFVTADTIRNGDFATPEDKPLKERHEIATAPANAQDFMNIPDNMDDEGLPFK